VVARRGTARSGSAADRALGLGDLGRDLPGDDGQEVDGELGRVVARRDLHHLVAERFAELGGVARGADAIAIHRRGHRRFRGERDAEHADLALDLIEVGALGQRRHVGRPGLRAQRRVEQSGAVAHRAADDVLLGKTVPSLAGVGADGCASTRRLEAEQAAARGGDTNRPAAVAGVGERYDAGGDRGRRASARAAGRPPEVPGIVGGAEARRLGHGQEPELGSICPAEHHEAGSHVPAGELAVAGGAPAVEKPASRGGGFAREGLEQILDEEGHPGEGAVALHARSPCLGYALVHHGVEPRIDALEPRDRLLEHLLATHLAAPDQVREADAVVARVLTPPAHGV
jgi:hypothetical protein